MNTSYYIIFFFYFKCIFDLTLFLLDFNFNALFSEFTINPVTQLSIRNKFYMIETQIK